MEKDRDLLASLRQAREQHPELAEVINLQHDLFAAGMQVKVELAIPAYGPEEVHRRLSAGVPLIRPEEMTIDWESFAQLYREVCRIAAQHRTDLALQFEGLLGLLNEHPVKVRTLATNYLTNGQPGLADTDAQGELLAFVLRHALGPFLRGYSDALAPMVEPQLWHWGNCPICEGEPDLAFLDDEAGARQLICSRCDSQWHYSRTRCPFCVTSEPTSLSYYPSEDEKYRLYVCKNCRRYLKTIDMRKTRGRVLFPVERITTVGLDVAAQEDGYT